MNHFNLRNDEVARVRRAAGFAGLDWQPICTRPKTARQFYKRVEAEMYRKGVLPGRGANRRQIFPANMSSWFVLSCGL